MAQKLKLYYWGIKARAEAIVFALEWAGIPYEHVTQFEWPGTLKAETPFGQVPYMVDGDVKMGQSMAILRYVGRKGGLLGDTDKDFAISEMLLEQQVDIYNTVNKANYSPNKAEAYNKAFGEEVPRHLEHLEKLLQGDQFGSKILLGDLAIVSVIRIILDLAPCILDRTPKLKAYYHRVMALPKAAGYAKINHPAYFKLA